MLCLGANIHQNLCFLTFLFTASFKLRIKFYSANGNSSSRSIIRKSNNGSLYKINVFFWKNLQLTYKICLCPSCKA